MRSSRRLGSPAARPYGGLFCACDSRLAWSAAIGACALAASTADRSTAARASPAGPARHRATPARKDARAASWKPRRWDARGGDRSYRRASHGSCQWPVLPSNGSRRRSRRTTEARCGATRLWCRSLGVSHSASPLGHDLHAALQLCGHCNWPDRLADQSVGWNRARWPGRRDVRSRRREDGIARVAERRHATGDCAGGHRDQEIAERFCSQSRRKANERADTARATSFAAVCQYQRPSLRPGKNAGTRWPDALCKYLIAAAQDSASGYVVKLRASSRLLAPSRRHADHECVAAAGSLIRAPVAWPRDARSNRCRHDHESTFAHRTPGPPTRRPQRPTALSESGA